MGSGPIRRFSRVYCNRWQGSGEILDREEAIRIELEAASGKYDLVIAEDLGRIYRRLHALLFCETCLDTGTRVIAVNDHVDTAVEGWKLHGIFAVMRHESYNEDTSKRIRRSHRDSFIKGGIIPTLPYGYIKPEGAKHDSMISKDPAAQRVYDKWVEMLESGASFSEIADWLNENGISPGKCARQEKWDCAMVSRHTRNHFLAFINNTGVNTRATFRWHFGADGKVNSWVHVSFRFNRWLDWRVCVDV